MNPHFVLNKTDNLLCWKYPDVKKWLVGFMIWSTIIDLGGGLGIKYLSYSVALLAVLLFVLNDEKLKISVFLIFIFGLWPIASFLIGLLNSGELSSAITQLTPFYVGLLFYLILDREIAEIAINHFFNGLYFLSIIIISFFLLFIVNPQLALNIAEIFSNKNLGYFGFKGMGDILVPGVYFKPTLFLPATFIYFYFKKEKIKTMIVLLAIFLSFSKAAIVLIILFLLFQSLRYIFKTVQKLKLNIYVIIFFLASVVFVIFLLQTNIVKSIVDNTISAFSGEAATTQVRFGHFESIVYHFSKHPHYFFIGQGLGTSFFSIGEGRMVNNIELDHLETIRKFGFFWFFWFFIFISTVIYKLKKQHFNIHAVSLLITFILVGTNPLLISPLFMMYLIILYKF